LLYHHVVDVDDVVTELVAAIDPEYADTYVMFLEGVCRELRQDEATQSIPAMERLSHEALALLTRSGAQLDVADMNTIQTWFPALTPQIVRYLTTGPRRGRKWVADFILSQLTELSGIDWIDAWVCHGAGRLRTLNTKTARALLRILELEQTGPLTRVVALRALATHNKLDESSWREVFANASPAMCSEILFSSLAKLGKHPWLEADLARTDDQRLVQIARALEQGASPDA
jgi:hypothetical protein